MMMTKNNPLEHRPQVLIVDDDVEHARTVARVVRREGYAATVTHHVNDALAELRKTSFDVVLTDLIMPGKSGVDLMKAMDHLGIPSEVIVMTAFGTVERAVEAMKSGAVDFVVKPIQRRVLTASVARAIDRRRLVMENEALKSALDEMTGSSRIIGNDPSLRAAVNLVRQAAKSDASVVILGESGTGKELFAHELHEHSLRSQRPFVALHCAALPESIIESELFGHEAGAFTGANRRKIGHIEAAQGGTLFLDELGELSLTSQVKLLRFLQEGEIVRVGGTTPVKVDARVVAATHRDLQEMVREGSLREDLFYRLNVIPVTVPPLRERAGDVGLLATFFLTSHAARQQTALRLSEAALVALNAHHWPGNVRELQNTIERAVVMDTDGVIDCEDLGPEFHQAPTAPTVHIPVGTSLADAERRLIQETLAHVGGDKALAASLLGVGRRTIYRKLEDYANDRKQPQE